MRSRSFYVNVAWVPIYDIKVASAMVDMRTRISAYSENKAVQKI